MRTFLGCEDQEQGRYRRPMRGWGSCLRLHILCQRTINRGLIDSSEANTINILFHHLRGFQVYIVRPFRVRNQCRGPSSI